MTSNRPLDEWAKLIGDVPPATAIPVPFEATNDNSQGHHRSNITETKVEIDFQSRGPPA
jgi:hypothetical protein